MKILVSGSNGQLGSELKDLVAAYPNLHFIFLTRNELPLDTPHLIEAAFSLHQPDLFINCAAYTAVDKAEEEQDLAYRVNGEAAGIIAQLCRERGCRLIHISTDYVFDGTSEIPLDEEAGVNPVSVYGKSKLLGEQLAMKENREAVIIRTSWVYSVYGKNFVKTMMRLMKEKESISVVSDQVGSPTYAADLAEAIMQIVVSEEWKPGIYHYSNSGTISWHEFALAIRDALRSSCTVSPIPTSGYPTPARRPAFSVMDTRKISREYGVDIKPWHESLSRCMKRLLS
jgi:dTDP-4-dehydrorhamnose reductase